MGWYAVLQVFRPGGVVNTAGTPNFLIDLSSDTYQAQWTELFQGGLDQATFDMRKKYESTLDLIFGNWIIWGCYGANLHSNANIGDGVLTIDNLLNVQTPAFKDLIANDLIMITDGVNTELFTVTSVSGSGPTWSLNLGSAYGNQQVATTGTTTTRAAQGANSVSVDNPGHFSNGDVVVFGVDDYVTLTHGGSNPLTWGGPGLTQSYPAGTPLSEAGPGATIIKLNDVSGITNASTVTFESARSRSETIAVNSVNSMNNTITLHSALVNSHQAGAAVTFQMPATLQNNYLANIAVIVRVMYQGYLTQRIRNTLRPDQMSIHCAGFFSRYSDLIVNSTVQNQNAGYQMKHDISSYSPVLDEIIVLNSNFVSNHINVNIQATNSPFAQIIDAILRQENGNSDDLQYVVYVSASREVHHSQVATVEPYQQNPPTTPPTYFMSLEDQSFGIAGTTLFGETVTVFGDTIASVQNIDMDGTSLMNAAIVSGTSNTYSQGTNRNTAILKTTEGGGSMTFPVESVPGSFPGGSSSSLFLYFEISQAVPPREIKGYGGTSGSNVLTSAGTTYTHNEGANIQIVTKLSGNPVGKSTFAVLNASIFEVGDEIVLSPTGSTAETKTITGISGNNITVSGQVGNAHGGSDVVALSSKGGGTAPQILVEMTKSIVLFGWFEGTLSNQDIFDVTKLSQWAGRQLKILGWPLAKAQVQLNNTAARIGGRDLVCIGPFDDATYLVQNVQQLQYNATAADANVSATLDLGVLRSTMSGVMGQKSKEHSVRHRYHNRGKSDKEKNHDGVHHGFDIEQTDPGTGVGNQVSLNAGTIAYKGVVYQVPAAVINAPEGTSHWGVDVSNPLSPVISEMPKRYWNGRFVYGDATYTIADQGDDPVLVDQFIGIPLYEINVSEGALTGYKSHWAQTGVGLGNFPSNALPPSPIITGSPAVAASTQPSGVACDLQVLSVQLTNVPTDNSVHEVKVYVESNIYSLWAHKHTIKLANLPQPGATQTISFGLTGLPAGATINVGITYNGLNGESAIPTTIVAAFTLPAIGGALGLILESSTLPSGVGLTANPLMPNGAVPGPGTLCIYTATGTGHNEKLYIYDEIAGWKAVYMVGT